MIRERAIRPLTSQSRHGLIADYTVHRMRVRDHCERPGRMRNMRWMSA